MDFDLSGITDITQDSREAGPGSLFAAIKGEKIDGVQFIAQAEAMGAVAVLCAADAELPPTKMRVIRAENPRLALAQIAAQFMPAQPEQLVAITGTDGKTSTADFFRQLAHLCGQASASIGTLGVIGGNDETWLEATHTTPGAISLHGILSDMAQSGITHVAMEASSHGLAQYRMHGARLQAAAFTNFARDHLDFHHTEAEYFAAKMKLFSEILPAGGIAVINADDKRAADVRAIAAVRGHEVVDFGMKAEDMKILSLAPLPHGQEMRCRLFGREHALAIPLVGSFQAMNILAAIGLALPTGLALDSLLAAVPTLAGVPGRLQLAATTAKGAGVYVDYAHTPAALVNILATLRPHTKGKLHLVFGCGGNRDAGKRPEMGKIASELADAVIVTDDNPRSEDPAAIRKAILAACPRALEIADRSEAIITAISALGAGDILVIAGKGHEKMQVIGGVEHPHDDVAVARAAVK
ncbi:MAG: UDP-N-acetylmuramoyl-L-alanyl-D-glutamate--2,6-diaminopimelate ligase [Alphaproteobacteria bacterium]|nr:UDP-N-acetylmuramoyl-L-alanyl-D-glutamate--2,6-diaminopimelate ligase [Alphaproteobacteria bacterium]